MAEPTEPTDPPTTDPRSGFSPETNTYRSLRPSVPLPPPTQPLSLTDYTLSLLHLSLPSPLTSSTPFLIDSSTSEHLSYSSFLLQTRSLSLSLRRRLLLPSLRLNNHRVVALVLSPPSLHVPVLYLSLLSLGIVLSPANPLSSPSELAHIVKLSKPVIAFSTSSLAQNLPESLPVVLLDSPEFLRMMTTHKENENIAAATEAEGVSKRMVQNLGNTAATAEVLRVLRNTAKNTEGVLKMMATRENSTAAAAGEGYYEEERRVEQSDTAAILYSSGTTGRVKGVELTHRNFIALIAGFYYLRREEEEGAARAVALNPLPLFHVFGFFMLIRAAAMGETVVLMERFDFEGMLRAVERYKVSYMPVSPPLVVAMAKSEVVERYDLGSLRMLGCGGAPLGKEAAERFRERFPNVEIVQGYGLTETGGGATRMLEPEEMKRPATVGRLAEMMEAKIVDPVTGEALPPGHRGELWLRGPSVMKGYVGDDEATAATLDAEGWLKTGDLCYFDSDGFLYIVDRLKELIKYKAYQVPPAELEHLLQSNPDIVDAAVIPYPDEEAGQIPMAFVVRKPGSSVTEAQIMDFIARQVAPYKKIRRVAFINSIPKSPAGKILRRELVNSALSGTSSKL